MELPSRQGGNLVEKTTWQMKGKAIPVVISSWPKGTVKVVVVVAAAVVEAERSCKKNVVALAAVAAAMVGAMLVAVAAVGVGP